MTSTSRATTRQPQPLPQHQRQPPRVASQHPPPKLTTNPIRDKKPIGSRFMETRLRCGTDPACQILPLENKSRHIPFPGTFPFWLARGIGPVLPRKFVHEVPTMFNRKCRICAD